MSDESLMKNGLAEPAVGRIAQALSASAEGFATRIFIDQAMEGLDQLELKQRVHHLIDVMRQHLPADFKQAAPVLKRVKANWVRGAADDPLQGFAAWPIIDYAAVHGIDQPRVALPLLRHLTSMFSAEFAIRPFILQHHELTYSHLQKWSGDRDASVRRLVSEGTRPRLPWGMRLPPYCKDPSPILPLLEALKDDPSETVRRSVANNLNDISKDNPDVVLRTCKDWLSDASEERKWLIRHATRTLVKAGHPDVFGLLGYTATPQIKARAVSLKPSTIQLGEAIEFIFSLTSASKKNQRLVIDYAVHHVKANGQTRPKVFKLKSVELKPGETMQVSKRHTIRRITTRTYYPGTHTVELLINGVPHASQDFELQV